MSGMTDSTAGWVDPFSEWLWQLPADLDDDSPSGSVSTSLPCPEWCCLPTGHAFMPRPVGLLRVHRRRFGDRPTYVALETFERAAEPTGPTDLGLDEHATLIRVQFPHASGYLTPAGARRLADRLRDAADTAEEWK